MNKKLILLLAVYLLFPMLGVFSCRKNNCGSVSPRLYKNIGMHGAILNATYNKPDFPTLTSIINDTVAYDEFAIQLNMNITTYSAVRETTQEFISTAYACDPDIPPITTTEIIDSIRIFCNKNFTPAKPEGNDLSDLFDVVAYGEYGEHVGKTDLRQYLATKPAIAGQLVLVLKSPPASSQEFIFIVKYYQKGVSYDYFEYTSPEVVIVK